MAMTEEQRAALSKKRGQAANYISDSGEKQKFIAAQGEAEGKKGGASDEDYQHLDREAEDTIATQGANKAVGGAQYESGTPGAAVDQKKPGMAKKALGYASAGMGGLEQAMADNRQREAAARDYANAAEARVRSELPSYEGGTPGVQMKGSHKVGAASFMPMYKDGTKKAPKTGAAKLHKGEVRVSHDAIKKAVASKPDRPGVPGSAASDVPMSLMDRIKAEASRRASHAANIPSDVGRAAMGALGGQPDEMQAGVAGAQADAGQAFGMPQYKKGVAAVPKTGPAVVHEGEAIIPKDEVDEAKKNGKIPPTIKKAVKNEKVRRDMSLLVPDDEHEEEESPEFEAGEREGAKEGDKEESAAHEAAESSEFEKGEQEGSKEGSDEPKKKDIHVTVSRAKNGGYVAHHQHNSPHPDEMYHLPTKEDMLAHMNKHMGEDEE